MLIHLHANMPINIFLSVYLVCYVTYQFYPLLKDIYLVSPSSYFNLITVNYANTEIISNIPYRCLWQIAQLFNTFKSSNCPFLEVTLLLNIDISYLVRYKLLLISLVLLFFIYQILLPQITSCLPLENNLLFYFYYQLHFRYLLLGTILPLE